MEIQIGDKVKFSPSAWTRADGNSLVYMPVHTTGEVVQVNTAHRWFRVRYTAKDTDCYETFKLPVLHDKIKIIN